MGIDLARLVAVAGMMAAHTLLLSEPRPPAAVVALVDGPPSTLFAVLGGVSVVLAARARLAAGERRSAIGATVVRGIVVALLGVVVEPLATAVHVVLVPFGISIAIAGPLLLLPSGAIALLAAGLWLVGGTVAALVRHALLPLVETGAESMLALLLAGVLDVLASGVYPVVTWLAYLLVGMLVARRLLAARAAGGERAMLGRLALAGAALTAAGVAVGELGVRVVVGSGLVEPASASRDLILASGYGAARGPQLAWQLVAAPHSGTPADIARTVGMALLVIAMLGLAVSALPERALPWIEPLRAAGGAPLTVYVVHVVLLSLLVGLLLPVAPAFAVGRGGWALQVAVALVIGAALAASGSRGPLERLVGWFAGGADRRRARPGVAAED